jgi:hypothetical protein
MQIMAICFSRYATIKKIIPCLRKTTSGKYSFNLLEVLSVCMRYWYFIVTWKVQTFFWIKMVRQSWEIWTFLKWPKRDCCIPKLGHHTTQVLKYGRISLTIKKVIYGLSDVFYMNLFLSSLLLGQRTCKVSIKKFWEVFIPKYLMFIHKSYLV